MGGRKRTKRDRKGKKPAKKKGPITSEEARKIYNNYDEYETQLQEWHYSLPFKLYLRIRRELGQRLPKSLFVFDAGAGTGYSMLPYGVLMEETSVARFGMDIAELPLTRAEMLNRYDVVKQGDLRKKIPFPSKSFHVSFWCGVSEYLPDLTTPVLEMARVTRRNGIVALTANAYEMEHPLDDDDPDAKDRKMDSIRHSKKGLAAAVKNAKLKLRRPLERVEGWRNNEDGEFFQALYWIAICRKK